jgi:hypothetical protein
MLTGLRPLDLGRIIVIDKGAQTVAVMDEGGEKTFPYYSKETFELLSDLWLATSWHAIYMVRAGRSFSTRRTWSRPMALCGLSPTRRDRQSGKCRVGFRAA